MTLHILHNVKRPVMIAQPSLLISAIMGCALTASSHHHIQLRQIAFSINRK